MRFSAFQEMLSHYARLSPDAPALYVSGKNGPETVSFAELVERVERRSGELRAAGKTCLAVFADGSPECVVTILAAPGAGVQTVLLEDSLPDEVAGPLLTYTDADCLWSSDEEREEELSSYLTAGVKEGAGKILFFTSGTTERAKAVVLTEASLCASAWNGASMLPLRAEDRLLCLLPLAHVFGFVCGLLWGLSCGAAVALGRGARHYADDCAYYRPTLLAFLTQHRLFNAELRLVLVGAGGCPLELIGQTKALGVEVAFGYGLTETSSGVAISVRGDPYAMEVSSDDTITLAEDGEILIEAPTCMMQGYYKKEADTKAVLRGGVLYTGDLGSFDAEGRLHLTGRKKDMLVLPDGTKLYLPEYEGQLSRALGTGELAVVLENGVPALLLRSESPDEAAVRAAIRPLMDVQPRGRQIGRIYFTREELPRTATGKLRRWEIEKIIKGNER